MMILVSNLHNENHANFLSKRECIYFFIGDEYMNLCENIFMDMENIFKNNKNWAKNKLEKDSYYFKNLSKGQSPDLLYIGCSDSRVPAEDLMGLKAGEAFIHRNIANMAISSDLNCMSVLNYAVNELQVKHIIVCGHYGCGGVRAALDDADMKALNPWLRHIKDVLSMHKAELDKIMDEDTKYKRLVELNVQEQCLNLLKTEVVQKAKLNQGITVHGLVFNMENGELIKLNVNSTPYKI